MRSAGRRTPERWEASSGAPKTPERWDFSGTSSPSAGGKRSAASSWNPIQINARAICSCFSPANPHRPPIGDFSEDFGPRSHHPIIHRDIKSSNILLTETLCAKVADFGFARLGATESGVSHVETQVKGTAGYLDPEYLRTYQLTEKSDVFSFGVLLVELVSGRRPIEPKRELQERVTPKWAMEKFIEGNGIQILDPNLVPSPATNLAVEKILELALRCLAPTRGMRRCAEILWNIHKDYRELFSSEPSQLGFKG